MPFRYFFSFRSNMVYLSFGSISSSVGISAFHRSIASKVCPLFASAVSSVATTLSTARSRSLCRLFWNFDSRQGIFHKRPLESGFVARNGPNIVSLRWVAGELRKTVGSCPGEFSKLFAVASDWPLRNLGGVRSGRNNDAPS